MTDWDTAVVVGRGVNIALAITALALFFYTIRGWKRRSSGNRFLWAGVGVMLFTTIFGTAEQLYHYRDDEGSSWRTALTTVYLAYIILGLLSKQRGAWTEDHVERRRSRQDDLRASRRFR